MSEQDRAWRVEPISRRSLLRAGLGTLSLAALSSCAGGGRPSRTGSPGGARTGSGVGPNVQVSQDDYGVHVGPSVAVNPRHPSQLLAVCGVSPTADPQFIATYISLDAGATWHSGGLPPQPAAGPAGDDLTVAFDGAGRGYVCATRAGHTAHADPNDPDANRAVYVWRTDDGGRSFSAPVTLLEGEYCDHPWLATAEDSPGHDVYVAWGAGSAPAPALGFTRSTDGGESFEQPRTILPVAATPSVMSAGPEIATGPDGLVVAVCDWTTHEAPSGDLIGEVVAIRSTDGGQHFSAPVHLGSQTAVVALPGNVLPNSMPTVAVSPGGEAVYAAFTTREPGAMHSDIMVTASHDRGQTWSSPVQATPDDAAVYFQPSLAVNANGRVAICAFALSDGRVDQTLLVSQTGNLRFPPPTRVTTTPFDPHSSMRSGGKHGAWWIGDCQGIATSGDTFHLVWNDTRTGTLDLFADSVRP